MRAYITIIPDNWQEGDPYLVEEEFDACQPYQFRVPTGQRYSGEMPRNSDQASTGSYDFYGFVYQPQVHVSRPNGYVPPVQVPWSPLNGQPRFQQGPQGPASLPTSTLRNL